MDAQTFYYKLLDKHLLHGRPHKEIAKDIKTSASYVSTMSFLEKVGDNQIRKIADKTPIPLLLLNHLKGSATLREELKNLEQIQADFPDAFNDINLMGCTILFEQVTQPGKKKFKRVVIEYQVP